jgi:ubiquinone/menaquinone biosynthesis C-methylase UbiE
VSGTDRFARTAERLAALQDARAERLAERVREFVAPRGDERALDVGTGAGALALALAPLVREVVGVDPVPELLALARERAVGTPNVELVEGDGTSLPFPDGSFDLAGTMRTLHHVERPELLLDELARVTRAGGRVLVVDQLAPGDAAEAGALHAFERARDPSHARLLSDRELRELFAASRLEPLRGQLDEERRELGAYLDLAGCEGEARARAEELASAVDAERALVGWYLLERLGA